MAPTERRQRITAIFERARKLRPEDQGRFLERECSGDGALIEELNALLSEHGEPASLEAPPPASNPSAGGPMPARIGRYTITGRLGSGGFGHVYSALDPAVNRPVAIKMLNAPGDADLIKRFRAEATTVANLHHKNIVTVHEFGEEDGAPYLVMELLEGTNVHDLIRQRTQLSLHEKLWIMSEVAEGLQCAHSRGVIHRDVKPANIMLLSDGSVKIMDFGIARMAAETSARLTQTGFLIGSLMYMAPEQFSGTADALTDIFAYGVTFYELLTSRHPFAAADPGATMYRIVNVDPAAVRSLVPDCPESVERIVNRTLAKSREARYSGLADVVADTKPILLDLQRKEAGEQFSQAQRLLGDDQLDTAHSAVRKALKLDPWHTEARQLRDRIDQALQRRSNVDRAVALLDRAEQELSQREYQKAAEFLASVKQMSLDDSRLNTRLERAYSQIEQAQKATRLLDTAREGLRKESLTEAFRAVSEVLASDPGNRAGRQILREIQERMTSREAQRKIQESISQAEGLLLIGETDQALALLDEMARREPSHEGLTELRERAVAKKLEEDRTRRLTAGVAAVKDLLKNRRFDGAIRGIDELLGEFAGNPELVALRRHAVEQATVGRRAEEMSKLQTEAAACIGRGEYDRAIRSLEAGIARLGDDGSLTTLLQSAVTGKAAQERERVVSGIAEDTRRLRREGKLDDAARLIERAIQRWGDDPPLPQMLQEVSQERKEKERRQRIADAARRANDLVSQQKPDAAIAVLRQAIERDGEDAELRKLLTAAESQVRDRSRSVRLNALLEEMRKPIAEKRWEDALRRIDEALREFPDEPALLAGRASVVAAIGSAKREQAIVEALAGIQSLRRENRLLEASELLEKSLRECGGDARLLEARQRLNERLAERQRAEYLENARQECRLLLQHGRFDDALRLLGGCEIRYPHSLEVVELLAETKSARETQERKQVIEKALTGASELVQQGNVGPAMTALEDALRLYPDSRDLADALARTGMRRDEAERHREIKQLSEAIERAIAEGDWGRAINRIAAGLEKFPQEPSLIRLKHTAEEGKHRSEIAEVETSAHNALQSGKLALAAEIVAAARIRWPQEKKFRDLQREVELNRADEDVSKAKQLLQAGRYDEAGQLAEAALRRWPKHSSAADLLAEIAARKSAHAAEEHPAPGGPPASFSKSRSQRAILGAAAVVAAVGLLYWVVRPRSTPGVVETKPVTSETVALIIGEPAGPLSALVGTTYTQALQTSGGVPPVSWMVTHGSLPPGVSLDRQTGRIEGAPRHTGQYTFVAQASDVRGKMAERTLTMTVAETPLNKSQLPGAGPAPGKPAQTQEQASAAPRPAEPKPVTPVPAAQASLPAACPNKAFILDQYGDSRSGELTWAGSLSGGGSVDIRNRRASTGYIRGDILPPGVPVRVSVVPESVHIVTAPVESNCWDSRLLLENSGSPVDKITIKWVVYQP